MKYEYIIILLLLVIVGLWSFQSCSDRHDDLTTKAYKDSLNAEMDTLMQSVAINHISIEATNHRIDSISKHKQVITAKYDSTIKSVRSASTVQLDSIIRTILERHGMLHN